MDQPKPAIEPDVDRFVVRPVPAGPTTRTHRRRPPWCRPTKRRRRNDPSNHESLVHESLVHESSDHFPSVHSPSVHSPSVRGSSNQQSRCRLGWWSRSLFLWSTTFDSGRRATPPRGSVAWPPPGGPLTNPSVRTTRRVLLSIHRPTHTGPISKTGAIATNPRGRFDHQYGPTGRPPNTH